MSDIAQPDAAARRREILARILAEKAATELDPTANWHPDINLAAIEALDRIGDVGRSEEAGVLLRNKSNGLYSYTVPVPGTHDNFSLRARFGPDYEMAGLFHIHPPDSTAQFSPSDIETAERLRAISFIKWATGGDIRRFDPATTRTKKERIPGKAFSRRVSEGDPVQRPVTIAKGTP
jgi:hypothetical protein